MAFWKQVLLTLILLAAVGLGYSRLVPGAGEQLAKLGLKPSTVALLTGQDAQAPGTADAGKGKGKGKGDGRQRGGFGAREASVVVQPVTTAQINDRVTAIGDGEALRSVTVVPLASGMLTEVNLQPGQKVEAGTVIARLDSGSEAIARDRAMLALKTANEALERVEKLFQSRTASQTQVDTARNARDTAELALREAKVDLEKRSIVAPIAGRAGIVPVEAGDYVTTQTEIATLDDRSSILVDFWLPEKFAPIISVGQPLVAHAVSLPGETFEGKVQATGSRIDRASRTIQVRALIENPDDRLRPGMSFRVEMRFPGQSWPAVDPLAIQWSSAGAHVWRASDGKAEQVPVTIIQRNSDSVLVDGAVKEGDLIITEGLQSLRPGAAIRVIGADGKEGGARPQVSDAS
ncbi:efflux transporter periplasmic adaptor subunit [Zhengella mangrovi]|uniref:Efflux transporter periplasmic adaptor subunit n=1 Tax=Zhengella mangrovi TaxID=1982044 RepID=A0A2G1QQC9_9HYPH|nr:efflux RND transporter periplasmic adaptor subunit [Zhengella mangrovi]PHP67674.1 efflux transporter periplasmic adaptor subunit [Zhengella mangrovi]